MPSQAGQATEVPVEASQLSQDELVKFIAEHLEYVQQARDSGLMNSQGQLWKVVSGPNGVPQMYPAAPQDAPKPPVVDVKVSEIRPQLSSVNPRKTLARARTSPLSYWRN